MGRRPASSARELALVDALPLSLPACQVARLVYGNADLDDRVLRRRRRQARAAELVDAMSEEEIDELLRAYVEKRLWAGLKISRG